MTSATSESLNISIEGGRQIGADLHVPDRLTSWSCGRGAPQQVVQLLAIHEAATSDHGVDLCGIRDLDRRIGSEENEIREVPRSDCS